jgi:hypothetical protein
MAKKTPADKAKEHLKVAGEQARAAATTKDPKMKDIHREAAEAHLREAGKHLGKSEKK